MNTVLALLQPLDPATGGRIDLRVSSVADRNAQGWNGERWWPAILEAPKLTVSLFEDELSGQASSKAEGIKLSLGVLQNADTNVGRFVWAKAPVTLYLHDGANASVIFRGRAGDFSADNSGALSVSLEIDEEPFHAQVLSQTYAGNGGAEGAPELKGRLKPWLLGRAVNVEPVLIDSVNSVYQCSGYGPIDAVTACYERGGSFGEVTGDYTDYTTLVAADLQPGQWGTCLAQGMIRLGAPAAGLITVDADGDNTGGFWRKTGEIIARLASAAGASGQIASGTLTALDAAVPRNIALYLTEQTTVLEVAQRLSAACNAAAGVNLLGELFVARIAFGTATITLDAQARQLPPVAFFGEEPVRAPYKRVMLGAARTWRVHTYDEIAFEAPLYERGIYDASTVYYEGNIVTRGDGSRWLYVATTAQAGVTPGTDDSVWTQLAPANALNATGPYSSSATYAVGDIVVWLEADGGDGSSYVRTGSGETIGVDPGDASKWTLFLSAGGAGDDGYNTAQVKLYQRAETAPADPTGTFSYDFLTTELSGGNLNGWSTVEPAANGLPLWFKVASAVSRQLVDDIAASEFTAAQLSTGAAISSATIDLFKRSAAAPAVPTGSLTYDFADKTLSGDLEGWSRTPTPTDGNPEWRTQATAASVEATDTISPSEWSAPVKHIQDGVNGTSPYTFRLTNEDATVPADFDGNVTSYANAAFSVQVFYGAADVTAQFSNVASPSNPQGLSITGTYPDFAVTGGFDAAEESASFTMRVVGSGSHVGVVLDRVLTLAKSKAPAPGASAPIIVLNATTEVAKYDKDAAYIGGDITFSAVHQNFTGDYVFRIEDVAGSGQVEGTAAALSTADPAGYSSTAANVLTIKAAKVAAFIASLGGQSFRVIAKSTGQTVTDSIAITKVQDGADGEDGLNGISPVGLQFAPANATIKLDAAGNPKSGELPVPFGIIATKDGAQIAITSVTITDSSGGTWSVSGSTINLTALTGGANSGDCTFEVVAGGQTLAGNVIGFSTSQDAANAAQTSKSWTASTTEANSGSFVQSGPTLAINARADGTLGTNLTGQIKPNGAGYQFVSKVQYSINGGSTYTDVSGSQHDSTLSDEIEVGGDGSGVFKVTPSTVSGSGPYALSGLGASAAVLLRVLIMKKAGATSTPSTAGNLTLFADAS